MEKLIVKSKSQSKYLWDLLKTINTERIEIITPEDSGCQTSIRVKYGNKLLYEKISEEGIIADWREPDVIRIAPVPLYNSYLDIYKFYKILHKLIKWKNK